MINKETHQKKRVNKDKLETPELRRVPHMTLITIS